MRPVLVRLHRWLGVATAIFLFVSGVTGALIAWDHAIDAWLNPQFFHARTEHRRCHRSSSRGESKPPIRASK